MHGDEVYWETHWMNRFFQEVAWGYYKRCKRDVVRARKRDSPLRMPNAKGLTPCPSDSRCHPALSNTSYWLCRGRYRTIRNHTWNHIFRRRARGYQAPRGTEEISPKGKCYTWDHVFSRIYPLNCRGSLNCRKEPRKSYQKVGAIPGTTYFSAYIHTVIEVLSNKIDRHEQMKMDFDSEDFPFITIIWYTTGLRPSWWVLPTRPMEHEGRYECYPRCLFPLLTDPQYLDSRISVFQTTP